MSSKFVTIEWSTIRDKRTTMQEKLILAEINQLTQLEYGCIASNQHFADLLGIKRQAASRAIQSLESKGFIKSEIKKGSRNTVRKIWCQQNVATCQQNVSEVATKCLETKDNITINKTELKDIELSHGFEDWWKLYPRKKSKAKALTIWKTKRLCHQSDSMIEKLKEQINSCSSMNGELKFIKHPTTYLNAGAWDDDIEPMEQTNGNNTKRETRAEQFERNMEQLKRQADGFNMGQNVIDVSDEMDGGERPQLPWH